MQLSIYFTWIVKCKQGSKQACHPENYATKAALPPA
jgi:hypothetical protein